MNKLRSLCIFISYLLWSYCKLIIFIFFKKIYVIYHAVSAAVTVVALAAYRAYAARKNASG